MRLPLVSLVFCVCALVCPPRASLASWDWVDMMGPLQAHQASVALISSEQQLYDLAKQGDWWGRTSAILRLGELATPKSLQAMCRLYAEWPADRVLDSPPDVSFFTLAALGATGTPKAHAYLESVLAGLVARTPMPEVADSRDRWLGALKGLSYFADASHIRLCESLAANPRIGFAVREWAAECAVEMRLSMRGLSSVGERAKAVCVELESGELGAVRRRAMERRLVCYATGDSRVQDMLASRAARFRNQDQGRAYVNIVALAGLLRSSPRIGNAADLMGRF